MYTPTLYFIKNKCIVSNLYLYKFSIQICQIYFENTLYKCIIGIDYFTFSDIIFNILVIYFRNKSI